MSISPRKPSRAGQPRTRLSRPHKLSAGGVGALAGALLTLRADAQVGMAAGALVLGAVQAVARLRAPRAA